MSNCVLLQYCACDRLRMVEDAVPGKYLSEMEDRRQELIGESLLFYDTLLNLYFFFLRPVKLRLLEKHGIIIASY